MNELASNMYISKISQIDKNVSNLYVHLIKKNGSSIKIRFSSNISVFDIYSENFNTITHEFFSTHNNFNLELLKDLFWRTYVKKTNNLLNVSDCNYLVMHTYNNCTKYVDIYTSFTKPIVFDSDMRLYINEQLGNLESTKIYTDAFIKKNDSYGYGNGNLYMYFQIHDSFKLFLSQSEKLKLENAVLNNQIALLNNENLLLKNQVQSVG